MFCILYFIRVVFVHSVLFICYISSSLMTFLTPFLFFALFSRPIFLSFFNLLIHSIIYLFIYFILGYFQLQANPGLWILNLAAGRGAKLFTIGKYVLNLVCHLYLLFIILSIVFIFIFFSSYFLPFPIFRFSVISINGIFLLRFQ